MLQGSLPADVEGWSAGGLSGSDVSASGSGGKGTGAACGCCRIKSHKLHTQSASTVAPTCFQEPCGFDDYAVAPARLLCKVLVALNAVCTLLHFVPSVPCCSLYPAAFLNPHCAWPVSVRASMHAAKRGGLPVPVGSWSLPWLSALQASSHQPALILCSTSQHTSRACVSLPYQHSLCYNQ